MALGHLVDPSVLTRRLPFFNMWYSNSSLDVNTYYKETFTNARYGGRTHQHGYRCPTWGSVVLELGESNALEMVSAMEDGLAPLTAHFGSLVDSRILVVVGWDAAVDWRNQVDGDGNWRFDNDTIARAYRVLNSLWDGGYIAELVPDYEHVEVVDGRVTWCAHAYDAAFFVDCDPAAGAEQAWRVSDSGEMEKLLAGAQVEKNAVPQGCRFEDGSIVVVADGLAPKGNPLACSFVVDGRRVEVAADDYVLLSPDLQLIVAGRLERLVVD